MAAMLRNETWMVALDALRANKVRAALTMLGVIIGSMCIVLVATISLTGRRYIIALIEGVGTNIVYAKLVRAGPQETTALSDEISMADLEAIRRSSPQVVAAAGTRSLGRSIVAEGKVHPISLVGVTEGFQRIRNLLILRGRGLDAGDMAARGKVCVITEELAKLLFTFENPVGQSVRVGELSFTVVGVFRERVSTFGTSEIQRETVMIPLSLMKYYTGSEFVGVLYVQATSPDDVPVVTRQLERFLAERHRAEAVYRVENLAALLETAQKIALALSVVLLVIGFIALLISGIGIMNIMLVTVTQRTREIGIRKAIGAPRREILWQFLLEAFIISGTGAVVGILIAVAIPVIVRPLLPGGLRVPVSWASVLLAFFVTCLTGILFGYLPANRAAKLAPTESLRYE